MHMACHLKRCIFDGPIMSFWAFSFERYNGTLEGLQKSWSGPEKQMLKKLIGLQAVTLENLSGEENAFVNSLMEGGLMSTSNSQSTFSSLDQTSLNSLSLMEHSVYYTCSIRSIDTTLKNNYILSQPKKEKCLTSSQFEDLEIVSKALNPDCDSITMSRFYYEHKQFVLAGEEYISERSRSAHSSFIAAYWCDDCLTGKIATSPLRIGPIKSIMVHKVQLKEKGTTQQTFNCFAIVEWLREHPHKHFMDSTVVITTTIMEPPSPASFIPIARIGGRCAMIQNIKFSFNYGDDTICWAIPIFKTSM